MLRSLFLFTIVGTVLLAGAIGGLGGQGLPAIHGTPPISETPHVGVTAASDPSVQASAKPVPADVGSSLNFYSLISGVEGGYSLNWSFGDGTYSPAAFPVHTYSAAANYTVILRLNSTDYNGSATIHVLIHSAVETGAGYLPTDPTTASVVNFTATPTLGTPPYVGFWNFGDGTTATGLSVLHTFHTAGTYTVRVWANDSGEGSASETLTVTVTAASGTNGGTPGGNTGILIGTSIAAVAVALAGFAYLQWDKRRRPKLPGTMPAPPPKSPP